MKPFWRNVILIALGHVALIAGLLRWSVAAKASSNPEAIVWLGRQEDLSTDQSEKQESPSPKELSADSDASDSEQNEAEEKKPLVTSAKSEIELPSATPKPRATATPRPKTTATPAARPKITPKPSANPTPKKTLAAKTSPKPVARAQPSTAKAGTKSDKKEKITLAKKDSASERGNGQAGSAGKSGSAGGGSSASEFGWYGKMLHDRFYSAWIQPTTNIPSGTKISTIVNVCIEKDGRVSKFEIAKPSGNATVNESVAAVAKQVSQVDPPPTGLIKGDHYDVKINFELNTGEQ